MVNLKCENSKVNLESHGTIEENMIELGMAVGIFLKSSEESLKKYLLETEGNLENFDGCSSEMRKVFVRTVADTLENKELKED